MGIAIPDLPRLWLDVADIHCSQGNWDTALQIIHDKFATEDSPLYRQGFLLEMECKLAKDPDQRVDIHGLLTEQESFYKQQDLPVALREKYEDLVTRTSKIN